MKVLNAIKSVLDKIMEWANIVLLACMTILVTYQVIARYFFSKPSAVAETLAQYMFVWTIMFGSAYVFGKREHLDITVLKDALKPFPRLCVDLFIEAVLLIFAVTVMLIGGWAQTTKQMIQQDAALQIPMGFIYAAIPFCGAAMLFYSIWLAADDVRRYKEKIENKEGN